MIQLESTTFRSFHVDLDYSVQGKYLKRLLSIICSIPSHKILIEGPLDCGVSLLSHPHTSDQTLCNWLRSCCSSLWIFEHWMVYSSTTTNRERFLLLLSNSQHPWLFFIVFNWTSLWAHWFWSFHCFCDPRFVFMTAAGRHMLGHSWLPYHVVNRTSMSHALYIDL